MPFQTQVNANIGIGVAGDFASTNPRATVLAGAGELVAGAAGLIIGRFGWLNASDPRRVDNAGSGAPAGFVARGNFEGTITTPFGESSMTILPGKEVTLFKSGDFFVENTGSGPNTRGQKAFASLTTGLVQFANAGATVTGYVETPWFAADVAEDGELVKITREL